MATSWHDEGASSPSARVQADVTKIREIHVFELRASINAESVRRSGAAQTWSETITPDVTKVRAVHINELRTATEYVNSLPSCTTHSPISLVWSDNPAVPNTLKIRATHINELRVYMNMLEGGCLCDCNGHCGCNGLCCNCDHCNSHCSPH
jgi:hypothetical protein